MIALSFNSVSTKDNPKINYLYQITNADLEEQRPLTYILHEIYPGGLHLNNVLGKYRDNVMWSVMAGTSYYCSLYARSELQHFNTKIKPILVRMRVNGTQHVSSLMKSKRNMRIINPAVDIDSYLMCLHLDRYREKNRLTLCEVILQVSIIDIGCIFEL